MTLSDQIAEILLEKGAVRLSVDSPFTYASGMIGPIYCDNRKLISHADARQTILDGFELHLDNLGWEFDVIGGTATAGIPWAAFMAERLGKPMIYIRPEPKGHGAGKQVEGDAEALKGQRVLIVEDLFTTGGSALKSAKATAKEMECEIVGIMSIFTYQFPEAAENFEEAGFKHDSLSNYQTLLKVGLERGDFTQEDVDNLAPFSSDPWNWHANLNKDE